MMNQPSPSTVLTQLASGCRFSQVVYVAAKLGIADLLAHDSKTSADLAEATQSHPASLRRLLRMLVALGLLEEDPPDRFHCTAVGALLRRDVPGSMRAVVLFRAGEETWQAWGALAHTVRTGEPAFEHIFGMHAFDYYTRFPNRERSQVHEEAMAAFTGQADTAIVRAYDFAQFRTIADVGGGNGTLLSRLLQQHLNVRGILFDLPHVVAAAKDVLSKAGVADRCDVIAGSFFDSIPGGAEAYLLKRIIHDWDDTRAAVILTQCRQVIGSQGKLLILDEVLPERANPTDVSSFLLDMEMLIVAPGGRERTEEEFNTLLCNTRWRLNRVVPTGHMRLSIVEALPT